MASLERASVRASPPQPRKAVAVEASLGLVYSPILRTPLPFVMLLPLTGPLTSMTNDVVEHVKAEPLAPRTEAMTEAWPRSGPHVAGCPTLVLSWHHKHRGGSECSGAESDAKQCK